MTYFERLKQNSYFFIVSILSQEIGIKIGQLISRRQPEANSFFYALFSQPDIQSIFIIFLTIFLWLALITFISPFIRSFFIKHGYLNK